MGRVPALRRGPASLLSFLRIEQDRQLLRIEVEPSRSVTPLAVWAVLADDDQPPIERGTAWIKVADLVNDGDRYRCSVELDHLLEEAGPATRLVGYLEIRHVVPDGSQEAADLAVDPTASVSASEHGSRTAVHRVELGRAARVEVGALRPATVGDRSVLPYLTSEGVLALSVDDDPAPYGAVHVTRMQVRSGVLQIRGRLATRHGDVVGAELMLKGRTTGVRVTAPFQWSQDRERTATDYGHRWYRLSIDFDCAELLTDDIVDDVYDAWATITTEQAIEPYDVRIGQTRFLTRQRTRAGWAERGDRVVAVNPYYTFRAKKTSFHVNVYQRDTFRYLQRQLRSRHLERIMNWNRDIWLIGERSYKAQDNGYRFFRHLREHHPEVEAYYVIERDSPERSNVDPLGNVVEFGSEKHIKLTLLAKKIAGTHHAEFLYPIRTSEFSRAVRGAKIFLQHGVMGTKWLVPLYGKVGSGFDTDMFVVSSEREKEYIVSDFGFEPDEVAVTGLPRFDSLLADDVPVDHHQLLFIPTWREWLQDPDAYPGSEYHEAWHSLLHHPRLQALVDERGLEVVFCLHPNMQQHRHMFDDVPARVISQGEVDVQRLMKESAMLVTDFSSVGFDFGFLHRPIVYFQFDQQRFLGPPGSHLDLAEELPGPIFASVEQVVSEIERQVDAGFVMDEAYVERADRFLAHRDRSSSERIFQRAKTLRRKRNLLDLIRKQEAFRAVAGRLRRHRYYFPAMRRMFLLVRAFPADRRLVFFESGVGKQYADSPRYIYEELVRRDADLRIVWSYPKDRLPVQGPNTRTVRRNSPRYFYYLARAHYWVNNQSFAHYLTRRQDGVYLQTWHGTPLKRMLHDLAEVHGRDSGYVERATTAAAQWSVLLSPSSFATGAISRAFRYAGSVLELGYPRNDVLHAPDRDQVASRVRARLGIRPDQRVVLYAPTFRDDQVSGAGRFTFELPIDLDAWHETFGDDTVLLLRMHVNVQSKLTVPPHLRHVVQDVSSYPEIQELYLASDVLITDYSSVFFDYAELRRPILFYAYDLDQYRDVLRGFYLDYETELPGLTVTTEAGLFHALRHCAELDAPYQARRDEFLARFAPADDGHATARVVDAVFGAPSQTDP